MDGRWERVLLALLAADWRSAAVKSAPLGCQRTPVATDLSEGVEGSAFAGRRGTFWRLLRRRRKAAMAEISAFV